MAPLMTAVVDVFTANLLVLNLRLVVLGNGSEADRLAALQ